jgi:replicative DNA helicase
LNQVELEKNVIAATLADPELADDLIQKCKPNYFTDNKMKKIYNWIVKKRNNNEQLSIVKLATEVEVAADELPEKDLFHEFDDSLDLLHKNYIRHNLKSVSKDIYNLAKKKDLDIDEYLHKSQEMIFKVTSELDNDETNYLLGDALIKAYGNYVERLEGEGDDSVKTGLYQIDNKWGGLKRKHLTVLGANSSVGKTAFAIKVMRNILFNGGKAAMISLEMDAKEVVDRLIVSESCVPANDYDKAQKLSEVQQNAIANAYNILDKYEKNLFISEKRNMNVDDIAAVCRKINKDMGQLDVIVVDYLQNIGYDKRANMVREIGGICRSLRSLALQLNVPIILVSQLTRSNHKEGKRPQMSDMRGGGEIEETADEIWLLHRPDYLEEKSIEKQNKTRGNRVLGEMIQEKGRTSGTGVCKMYFYKDIVRWEDGYELDMGMKNKIEILRK